MVVFQHTFPAQFQISTAHKWHFVQYLEGRSEVQPFFFFYALKFGACGWVQAQWQLIYTIRDPLAHPGDVQQHLEPQFLQLLLDLLLQLFSLWAGTCMVPWWKAPSSLSSHPVSLRLEMESLYTSDQFLLMYSAILMSFWFILSRLFQAFFPNSWSDWQLQFQYWMLR